MSLDNRIKAFELLQETLFAFEDMSSDKRWLTVATSQKDETYMKSVNDDLRISLDNFKRLRGEVLKIMEKGLDCQEVESKRGWEVEPCANIEV